MTNDEAHALASYTPTLFGLATYKAVRGWAERERDNARAVGEPVPSFGGGANLTKRQREILDYIIGFMDARGYCPSLKEIADDFGLSSTTVHKHMAALERRGAIRREYNKARSISIVRDRDLVDWAWDRYCQREKDRMEREARG